MTTNHSACKQYLLQYVLHLRITSDTLLDHWFGLQATP